MKHLIKLLSFITLTLALASPTFALNKVTSAITTTASTVCQPSGATVWISIQNVGAGDVNLSFDGTNPTTGGPTTGTGHYLAAGKSIQITIATSTNSSFRVYPVIAILATATTTTLRITTNDTSAT